MRILYNISLLLISDCVYNYNITYFIPCPRTYKSDESNLHNPVVRYVRFSAFFTFRLFFFLFFLFSCNKEVAATTEQRKYRLAASIYQIRTITLYPMCGRRGSIDVFSQRCCSLQMQLATSCSLLNDFITY